MILSIALGIILAFIIIYVVFNVYIIISDRRAEKKEERRLIRNAEIEEMKKNGQLKYSIGEPFSETYKKKMKENWEKSEKILNNVSKRIKIGFFILLLIGFIIVVIMLITKIRQMYPN